MGRVDPASSAATVQGRVAEYLARMAGSGRRAVDVVVDEIGDPDARPRVAGLTGATLETAPTVCHECVWWQSRGGAELDKQRWIERVELDWGAFGTVYYDDDGRVLGSMQYGPPELFPRAYELPGGPPSDDAVLVTCAYLVDESTPWVLQSLFLAAIGEARDTRRARARGVRLPLPRGRAAYERFRVHQTVFPRDFLADFGFRRPRGGPGRARAARARRPPAGCRGHAREGAARRQGGVLAGAGAGSAAVGTRAPVEESIGWNRLVREIPFIAKVFSATTKS